MITIVYTSGLEQYPTIIGFNLPLNFPPGKTSFGNRYAGRYSVDWRRVALKDIRLLYGELYGNANRRNVSIRFIVMRIHGWYNVNSQRPMENSWMDRERCLRWCSNNLDGVPCSQIADVRASSIYRGNHAPRRSLLLR
jgi:hypothetical protein